MEKHGVLLVDALNADRPSLSFTDPHEIVFAHTPGEVAPALARIEAATNAGAWAAGFIAYEAGLVFEERLRGLCPARSTTPLVWFGLYSAPRELSLAEVRARLQATATGRAAAVHDLTPERDFAAYAAGFDTIMANIAAGDCYQVNYTFKARFTLEGDAAGLFAGLLNNQKVAHGALIDTGEQRILSLSPELFVRRTGSRIETRPMKGTAPRGRTTAEDIAAREALTTDEKSRAENLMIVDLLRNDVGRIAETGSVTVTDLFTIETYRSLHQMTSGIRARLKAGTRFAQVVANLFPCGSITGAPKIRAMQIIGDVEAAPRGVYTGAIGHVAPGGDFAFNVAIRTAVIEADDTGTIGIGGGIVADSEARAEYDEALLKMRFLRDSTEPLALIETMLWEKDTGFVRLERHMNRLAASAGYFAIPVEMDAIRNRLDRQAADFTAGRMRVRLLLDESGEVSVTATELPPVAGTPVFRFVLAGHIQDSANVFLAHKTTRRGVYDPPRQQAVAAYGVDEVVFCNERGELTEGSITSLFVERGGRLLTPPLAAGLLPGTLRAELLESGRAEECTLLPADLDGARVFLGNSVRGLMPAEWVQP